MSADDFSVLFEQKKFLIRILLAAVAEAFQNDFCSTSLERFQLAVALAMKVCLDSKRSFRSTHFLFMYVSYLDFADLK